MLSSCGGGPKSQESVILGQSDDSSPIIVSDGSIHVKHGKAKRDHFTDKNPKKHEEIKEAHYQPKAFGYKCDPSYDSTAPCRTDCEKDGIAAGCKLTIAKKTKSWILSLCESNGPCTSTGTVRVEWDDQHPDKMPITSYDKDFSYSQANSVKGAELTHTSDNTQYSLQSASLKLDNVKTSYDFTCTKKADCLTIAYECHDSGKACLE
jgi:hypothetical protein